MTTLNELPALPDEALADVEAPRPLRWFPAATGPMGQEEEDGMMMQIKIKNRWTLAVLFECEADSMKSAVELAAGNRADLRDADLRGAYLRDAYLRGANLRGAYLQGADLQGANLQGADPRGADLRGADLRDANLRGANLQGVYLQGVYLQGANLQGADLQGADLRGANLQGVYLQGVYLQGAYLRDADLQGADLQGANLQGADLRDADLRGAYLRDAYLRGAYLRGAYLQGANLQGANLRGAKWGDYTITIAPLQILGLCWDVLILDTAIKIGCQTHAIDEWDSFSDAQIAAMSVDALTFWREHKALIMSAARLHAEKAAKANESEKVA